MVIKLNMFGNILISRTEGKEALAQLLAYHKPQDDKENIELDFSGIDCVGPSWMDEVLWGLKQAYGNRIICRPSPNLSVTETLKFLEEIEVN